MMSAAPPEGMAFKSDADRRTLIRGLSICSAFIWPVVAITFEVLLGPQVRPVRALSLAVGLTTFPGLVQAIAQWLLLRRYVPEPGRWIPVTTAGATLAGLLNGLLFYSGFTGVELYYSTLPVTGVLAAAIAGAVMGLSQWLVLRKWVAPGQGWRGWAAQVTSGSALAPLAAWPAAGIVIVALTFLIGKGYWPLILAATYLAAGLAGGAVYARSFGKGLARFLPGEAPVAEAARLPATRSFPRRALLRPVAPRPARSRIAKAR